MPEPVITVNNLVKTFGRVRALDGLNLGVVAGEVHGFLGPNGAGKSTTIRVLLGLLRRDSGDVQLFGQDPWGDSATLHKRLAYVPGDVNLWPNLSGGEAIDVLGALRGGLNKQRRAELLDRFKLDPTKKCGAYSKGNRQKVAIVAALASDVDLYVLDEPTSGLDPLMQAVFNDEIAKLKAAGKTVLLSSHVLAEVEVLCDRVTIIKEGKTIESGTLDELRTLTLTTIEVQTTKPIMGLDKLTGLQDVRLEGKKATLKVESANLGALIKHVSQFGVVALKSTPPTLEELFLRHYGDTIGVESK